MHCLKIALQKQNHYPQMIHAKEPILSDKVYCILYILAAGRIQITDESVLEKNLRYLLESQKSKTLVALSSTV